jgi:leucyl aminopeptidase
VSVRDEKVRAAEGFGGIVAVGMGSTRPPRLIELTYTPADLDAETPRVVLVGKGITYDAGGLSLKPREAMVPMKTDMSGGAVVVGVLSARPSRFSTPMRKAGSCSPTRSPSPRRPWSRR